MDLMEAERVRWCGTGRRLESHGDLSGSKRVDDSMLYVGDELSEVGFDKEILIL